MNHSAELISIGSELLCGRTLNTHGRDLGGALASIGLELVRDTTIPDHIETIRQATKEALLRTDLLFISGGLGPTQDDITRDALSLLLEQRIVPHAATIRHLTGWYKKRGRSISAAGERQALVLENAAVLPNSVGAAPGQRIDLRHDKTLFILPGPPAEFNAILTSEIIPWLCDRYADARPRLVRTVRTRGIGESDIVTRLEQAGFQPKSIDLGFYPGGGHVEIRLTADAMDETAIEAAKELLQSLLVEYLQPEA